MVIIQVNTVEMAMNGTITGYIRLAIGVSRFRFWLYLGGTYIVGFIIGASSLTQFTHYSFLLQLLYFIIPANIFLYGINDLADQDTDQYNIKKGTKEVKIEQKQQETDLKVILILVSIISFAILFLQNDWTERILFITFYFLSFAYSYPPFRFKTRPVLDFSSNILYVIPGILAYYQSSDNLPPFLMWVALFLWTGAMHLFSAVPDISADKQANVTTTAVILGKKSSLWLCFIFWFFFIFIAIVLLQAFTPWSYIAFLYPLIPLSIILYDDINIDRVYWLYPYINSLLGFMLSVIAGWDLLEQFISGLI